MGAWADERAALLEYELCEWPDSFRFDGALYPCISPPQEIVKLMLQNAYEMNRPATFSMRKSDFNSSGIADRNTIVYTSNGKDLLFQVYQINFDAVDPIVDLICHYKQ